MKKVSKEFNLAEIRLISEKLNYILSLEMKAGLSYKIQQWGRSFISKGDDIIKRNNVIILKYLNKGESDVSPEKKDECQKELTEFYLETDKVEFSQFQLEWIENLVAGNISVLYQFIDDSLFDIDKKE